MPTVLTPIDLSGYLTSLHSLTLADRLAEVKRLAKIIKDEESFVVESAKTEYELGEVFYSSEGRAFKYTQQERKSYTKPALEFLQQKGLLTELASVTQGSIDRAFKSKKLSGADYDQLMSMAQVKTVPMITDYKPDFEVIE